MERIPALDGLRALAILLVVVFHAWPHLMPAGYWGVILFFVLSGYLITRLLCVEMDDNGGRIDIRNFYWRRALRLLPALFVFCIVALLVGMHWTQVTPALFYYANFARIAGMDLELLQHTWTLSVEEHFYLIWPLVVAAVPARLRLRVVGALLLLGIAWRAIVIITTGSLSWVYMGTDTNAAALLAGCYMAVASPKLLKITGLALPAMVVLASFRMFGEHGDFFFLGGFVAIALSASAVHYALSQPKFLEFGVFVWVGKVSYGLYLWHYLILRSNVFNVWVALGLSVVVTALSWYIVEEPVRRWRVRRQKQAQAARLEAQTS